MGAMSLAHVKSLVVRFHPFHPHNSTIRHFLAQVESPAYQKRYVDCEMSCEVVHDRMVDPVIELVYENKSKLTVKCLGKSVADLFGEIQSVMEDSERIALEATPENDEVRQGSLCFLLVLD